MRTLKRSTEWRTGLAGFSDCLLAGLLVALASIPVVTAAPAFAAGCRILDRSRHDVGGPLWTTFWADFRSAARGGVGFGLACLVAVALFAVDLAVVTSMPGAGVLRPALWVLAVAGVVVAARTCELVATGAPAGQRWGGGAPARISPAPAAGGAAGPRWGGTSPTPAVSGAAGRWPGGGPAASSSPTLRGQRAAGGGAAAGTPAWRRAFVAAARETAADPKNGLLLAAAVGIAVLLVWMLPILALVVAGPLALAAVATGGRR
ncbi:DUF624 domain-containing protein [Amycolatopsis sp. MtRt-6]|uniref:DUF624 domain-containing protein n=1 Tax=Amycolatopsis sp. MtRt-6 TaxID=2792782 RepID=UPI001F5CDD47|nr:DUF624 domain-containing protein [Amycolatopsis sp. MtRt-6]